MMSKKALLALAIPFTFSSAFATVQMIPKAVEDLQFINNPKNFVLKSSQGSKGAQALNITPENWFNLSPAVGVEGVGTEDVYAKFGMPTSQDIIVAVIDSGVDVNHEDLQGKIWINEGEIPNDGIDNDGNGFIDDVFGWNFIGGSKGMATIVKDDSLKNGLRLKKGDPAFQIDTESLEVTRELARMKKLKNQVERLGETLSASQEAYLAKLTGVVEGSVKTAQAIVKNYTEFSKTYKNAEKILKANGVSTMTDAAVRAVDSTDLVVMQARADMLTLLSKGLTEARITRVLDRYNDEVNFYYNVDYNPRELAVGDDASNQRETNYGNNDVIGPDSSHGTHVSGSIAAVRDNGIGIKGVATNVKIMAVRVIPNGDERDKDVANGIRYAVDNGAKIINMSFGKAYSPYKSVVDEAVRYAESKGVLLVHAAGNDNKDNDITPSYPSRADRKESREFSNWLEIGASSYLKGLNLPATFSNFGKKTVDFFAPGVDILSTTPDNSYDTYSGTSMATPTTAGVAALILSYAPELDMTSLKSVMIDTSRRYPNLLVKVPSTETKVLFSKLSTAGSVVDAFEAVKSLK